MTVRFDSKSLNPQQRKSLESKSMPVHNPTNENRCQRRRGSGSWHGQAWKGNEVGSPGA